MVPSFKVFSAPIRPALKSSVFPEIGVEHADIPHQFSTQHELFSFECIRWMILPLALQTTKCSYVDKWLKN